MRQQLRKRGLPVSGTKPALLQRLRPFQLQHACPTPAPLSKLGTSMEPLSPCAQLPPCQSPGSSPGFRLSSPGSSPNQQLYIQDGGIPNGILSDGPNRDPNGALNAVPKAFADAASVSLAGERRGLGSTVFWDPASTASGTPSPSLPMSSSSPLQCGTPWRTDREQQEHLELSVKLEKRERKRSRHTDFYLQASTEVRSLSVLPQKIWKACDILGTVLHKCDFSPTSLGRDPFIRSCNKIRDAQKGRQN